MSDAPFFQLDVNEYLVATMSMSLEEKAVYLDINLFMWKSGGSIRFDEKKFSMMCRVTQARFLKIWDAISENFSCEDGVIFDEKMQEKLQKISEKSSKNSRNGSLGGKAKSLKNNNTGLANARKSLKYARVSKLESELEEKDITKDNIPKKSAKSEDFILPDWIPLPEWDGHQEIRKIKKAPNTPKAKTGIVNELEKLREAGYPPDKVLQQSINRGWVFVFEIKQNQGGSRENFGGNNYTIDNSNGTIIHPRADGLARCGTKVKSASDKWDDAWAATIE